jgi:hypothetical protein
MAYTVGYALVFGLFGLIWLGIFFPGIVNLRNSSSWPALTLGALGLLITLSVQAPAQQWLSGWSNGYGPWVVGSLLLAFSGVLQELLKTLGIALSRLTTGQEASWKSIGLTVGLGYAIWEAWQLVAWPLGTQRMISWVPVVERFSAIGLHIGTAAIIAYGFTTRRVTRFALLAALVYVIGNYASLLYQQWVVNFWAAEAYIFAAGLLSVLLASYLYRQVRDY